jgi:hypothetical protein
VTWPARSKPIRVNVNVDAYRRQMASAKVIEGAFLAYVREIGCKTFGDSIETTPEQATLLDAKWKELAAR